MFVCCYRSRRTIRIVFHIITRDRAWGIGHWRGQLDAPNLRDLLRIEGTQGWVWEGKGEGCATGLHFTASLF